MALYLTEQDVESLLTMSEAVEALDNAFRRQALGDVVNQPRRRLYLPQGTYHTMVAGDVGLGAFAIKTYAVSGGKARFLVLLYDAQNGDLLALIEADKLGQVRTGAASGIATRYLARQHTGLQVGIYGTGWQAQTQLEAICAVRRVDHIVAWGRDPARRESFCATMSARLGVPVAPADAAAEAAEGKDIVITATSAREPVLRGEWLSPGAHINAVGSNLLMKREIDEETIRRSDVLVVDSKEQARCEAGDLLAPFERRLFRWEQVAELADIVAGICEGRTDDQQITLFKSHGIALEDLATAYLVYHKAVAAGRGTNVPMWQGTG